MHILLVVNGYVTATHPAYGAKFRILARAHRERGYRIGIVAVKQRITDAEERTVRRRPSLTDEQWDGDIPIIRNVGWQSFKLNKLPEPRLRKQVLAKISMLAFRRYVNQFGVPDVIHAHGSLDAGLAAVEIKRRAGVPYVLVEHLSIVGRGEVDERIMPYVGRAYADATVRAAVSPAAADRLRRSVGSAMGAWDWVPNILDPRFGCEADRALRAGVRLFTASRLTQVKGFDVLLRALASLVRQRREPLELRMAGDGALRSELQQLSAALGVADRVTFLGNIDRDAIAAEMAEADMYVMPSRFETFGIPVIEALASGTPVIATRSGGIAETVVAEHNGVLVPVDDIERLARGILTVRDRLPSYDRRLISEEAHAMFSPSAVVDRYAAIYDRVLTVGQGSAHA